MIELDATNQSLGRLASAIAVFLRGKHDPRYEAHLLPTTTVHVTHIENMRVSGNKESQKVYYRYSGYPGGIRAKTLGTMKQEDPKKLLRLAVYRMLAKNRLRDKIIKNLSID